jgi:hypothetical protein
MSDVGLRSMHIRVDYKMTKPGSAATPVALPAVAVVDLTTLRQHWRNTHVFDSYKSFSADVEQDPNVKIHAGNAVANGNDSAAAVSHDIKEKP